MICSIINNKKYKNEKFLFAFAFCAFTVSGFANNEVLDTKAVETPKKLSNELCCTAKLVVDGVVVASQTSCATMDKATNCRQAQQALLTVAPK